MPADSVVRARRCPACQTPARKTAVYCRMCGTLLPSGKLRSLVAEHNRELEQRTVSRSCSACGNKIIPGEVFCSQCGVQLPPVQSPPPSPPSKLHGH